MKSPGAGVDPRIRLLENLRKAKIPGMDGIRGIAALSVVAFHDQYFAHGDSGPMFPGRFAVQIFFVVSGLLITWLMFREEDKEGAVDRITFYWRRAFRLLPPLFAVLLWQYVTHLPSASRGGMLSATFYCANYYELIHGSAALDGLGQMWSLAVEEHFYLIWPLLFVVVRKRQTLLRICLTIMGLQLAWRLILGFQGKYVYAELATETASCAILAGCVLALLLRYYPERLPRFVLAPWLGPISLIAILGLAQMPRDAQLWWGVPLGIPFASVILLQAVAYEWRFLENSVGRYLGRISYSVYLWGMVAIEITHRIGYNRGHVAVLAVVIVLGSASYLFVEQPIQAFGRQWLIRNQDHRLSLGTATPGTPSS